VAKVFFKRYGKDKTFYEYYTEPDAYAALSSDMLRVKLKELFPSAAVAIGKLGSKYRITNITFTDNADDAYFIILSQNGFEI
jgi:hypothetical protein